MFWGRPSVVVRPLTPISREASGDIFLLIREISVKHATNIHHVSGNFSGNAF